MPTKRKATDLLRKDHEDIRRLFCDYQKAASVPDKETIVSTIVMELDRHLSAEEQIFYPAANGIVGAEKVIDDLVEEHHKIRLLIDQVHRLCADQDSDEFQKKVYELKAAVMLHMNSEESVLMPRIEESSSVDLPALADEIMRVKSGQKPSAAFRNLSESVNPGS